MILDYPPRLQCRRGGIIKSPRPTGRGGLDYVLNNIILKVVVLAVMKL